MTRFLARRIISLLSCVFFLVSTAAHAAQGPLVNASTLTITSGGTWQALFPANTNRSTVWVENPCTTTSQGIGATESLFIAFATAAPSGTAGAFELGACGSLVMTQPYVSQQAVWVYGASTSHAFIATQTR